jgi:hypothetical protein
MNEEADDNIASNEIIYGAAIEFALLCRKAGRTRALLLRKMLQGELNAAAFNTAVIVAQTEGRSKINGDI